jgi:hypothetical protein
MDSASVATTRHDRPPATAPAAPAEVDRYSVTPLDEGYRRYRWIKPLDAEWAQYCDRILREHGAVRGQLVYERHAQARWRARRLEKLWVDLGLHERWELREHIDKVRGGWIWTIEYLGRAG